MAAWRSSEAEPSRPRPEQARSSGAGFRGHHTDLRPHLGVGIEVRNLQTCRIWTRLRRLCQGSKCAACPGSGNECGSCRSALRYQPSLRLQCHRNAVTNLLPRQAVRQVAIRCKSIVPKVGLEPTPSCEDRILRPGLLPYPWYWKHVAVILKVLDCKAVTMLI